MDTAVKCTQCFAHVDGFYTDSEGKRLCKSCKMELAGTVELAALRAVADAARAVRASARSKEQVGRPDVYWLPALLFFPLCDALDALDGETLGLGADGSDGVWVRDPCPKS